MKFSSSERQSNYDNFNFFPGPGHYDSKTSVGKSLSKAQRKAPKTAFNHGSERFDGPKNEIDLGPGYYFGQKEWESKKLYRDNKAQFYPNPRKIITIPSIPSSTHAMGYVEREDGYLIPLNGSSLKEDNELGPGSYHPDDSLTKKKTLGFSLVRVKSPRFPEPKNEADDQQKRIILGNYTLPKREIIEEEPSESPTKKTPKKVRPPKDEAKIAQVKSDENPGLAPGYYYNEKIASSFNAQIKDLEFQNFGSTAKRFQNANNIGPGPGFYSTAMPEITKLPYARVEPFSKGQKRFRSTTSGKLEELPGPGTYDFENNYSSNPEVSHTSFPSAFGSGANRFVSSKTASELPGPGSYSSFMPAKKTRKRKSKPLVASVLHTGSQDAATNAFARELSYAPELEVGGRSKGAVIVKHEEPANKGTSAFQSAGVRFGNEKDKRSLTPGPGSYEFTIKLGVKPSFSNVPTSFALTPRDREIKGENFKKVLGPGVYDYTVDPIKQRINYTGKINPIVPTYGAMLPK